MSRATASRSAASRGSSVPVRPVQPPARGYFQSSELPLISLVFLLPLLILYEVGYDRFFQSDIRAFSWMQALFQFFGASGRHLPALAVVGILLSWHIARNDPWKVQGRYLLGMLAESVGLAVPLILIGRVTVRYLAMSSIAGKVPGWMLLSMGAGIYEELVFRLIAFTALSLILIDILKVKTAIAYALMVVLTSLGFSLYHYIGGEPFAVGTFAFRTMAGLYFGAVFAFRGFGISAGSHAAYDIIVSALLASS